MLSGFFFLISVYLSRAVAPLFVDLSNVSALLLWLKHPQQKLWIRATAPAALAILTRAWVSHSKAPGSSSSQGRTPPGAAGSARRGWAPPAPGPLGSQNNSSQPFSANYSCDHTGRAGHSGWTLTVHYLDGESRWAWHLSRTPAAPKSCCCGKGKTPSSGKQAKLYISQLPPKITSAGAATLAFTPSCSSCKLELPAEIPQEGASCIAALLVHGFPGRARPDLLVLH